MSQREKNKREEYNLPRGYIRDKIDELLIRFMSLPETQEKIQEEFEKIKRNEVTLENIDDISNEADFQAEVLSPRLPSPTSLPSPRSENNDSSIRKSTSFVNHTRKSTLSQSPRHSKIKKVPSESIPKFFFPLGGKENLNGIELERQISKLYEIFPSNVGGSLEHVEMFCDEVKIPRSWRKILCYAASQDDNLDLFTKKGELRSKIQPNTIERLWRKTYTITDTETLFMRLLTGGFTNLHIDNMGLHIFLLDLIFTVNSLKFLREASDFFDPYVTTVVQRLGFVCRAWNGYMSKNQLKQSKFLDVVENLSQEDGDINNDHSFFSYEHFYVIYCKFFELDNEKQMSLSFQELSRYSDGCINPRAFSRIFLLRRYNQTARFEYKDFVWFIIAEEDKTEPMSIEYWFYILDQDGDGLISMHDMEEFYAEQLVYLSQENIEPILFKDKIIEIIDRLAAAIKMTPDELIGGIELRHLKRSREVAQPILDTFINTEKYVCSDQSADSDPKADQLETQWEKFAQEEYRILIEDDSDDYTKHELSISAYESELML